ncbi:MAG: putative methyltransferase [Nocardioides sp.]|nr:putative methyltransferase [Nocardioides sp.]
MGTDRGEWHAAYARPGSGLPDRLDAVRSHIVRRLDATAPRPVRVVSAGDGRDLLGALSTRADAGRVTAVLVERDPTLADLARAAARAVPAHVEVREADAARSDVYADAVPADLVLLCGIFGNISDADVRMTIEAAPQLRAGCGGHLDPPPRGARPHPRHPPVVRRRRFRGGRLRRAGSGRLVGRRAPPRDRAGRPRARPPLVHVRALTSRVR